LSSESKKCQEEKKNQVSKQDYYLHGLKVLGEWNFQTREPAGKEEKHQSEIISYKAINKHSKQEGLIKLAHKNSEQSSNGVFKEIQALTCLSHFNIIQLVDIVENDNVIGVVTEFPSNGNLYQYVASLKHKCPKISTPSLHNRNSSDNYKEFLKEKHSSCQNLNYKFFDQNEILMNENEIKLIIFHILSGLEHAHNQYLFHGNLNLWNIFVTQNNVYKIGNWNCSSFWNADQHFKKHRGPQSDVRNVGLILYHLLQICCGKAFEIYKAAKQQEEKEKNKNEATQEENLKNGAFEFSDDLWDFLSSLMGRNSRKITSTREALDHVWFKQKAIEEELFSISVDLISDDCVLTSSSLKSSISLDNYTEEEEEQPNETKEKKKRRNTRFVGGSLTQIVKNLVRKKSKIEKVDAKSSVKHSTI